MFKYVWKTIAILGFIVSFSGCVAVTGHGESIKKFDIASASSKCEYKFVDEKIKEKDDTTLWGIQGGSLARNCKNYEKSNSLLEAAENDAKVAKDLDNIADNALESVGSVLVNNNINDYEGNVYDIIMVNTYKGLNYMSMNDFSNARVEFNRALDRQRRAKEYFQKEIEKKKEENSNSSNSKAASNPKTQEAIYSKYSDVLNGFEAYPNYVNPFTTYMSGLFFMLDGSSDKARDLFKEVMLMDPKNEQLKKDFKYCDNLCKSVNGKQKENYAWVIYENGQGMTTDEMRIHIPVFLLSRNVAYTGIALPKIKERSESYPYLDINGNKTIKIANMDNVIKAEFKKKFPGVVTEAVISAIAKTVIQKQAGDKGGLFGQLAAAAYQGLTNRADVRSWSSLPKNFQSTRVKLDGNPIVIKNDAGEVIKTVNVPKNSNAIIYVKSELRGNNKVHEIIF